MPASGNGGGRVVFASFAWCFWEACVGVIVVAAVRNEIFHLFRLSISGLSLLARGLRLVFDLRSELVDVFFAFEDVLPYEFTGVCRGAQVSASPADEEPVLIWRFLRDFA